MGILQIILLVIQYGPSLFSLVSEIVDLIRKLRGQEKEGFEVDLKRAVDHYRRTKDRRPLRELRERLQKRCFGACGGKTEGA